MTEMLDRTQPAVADRVTLRFGRAAGRERLEAELRRVALDVVGKCEHDELDATAKELLRGIMDSAISASSGPLVARFTAELGRGIAGLPEPLRERLCRAEERRELGWD